MADLFNKTKNTKCHTVKAVTQASDGVKLVCSNQASPVSEINYKKIVETETQSITHVYMTTLLTGLVQSQQ